MKKFKSPFSHLVWFVLCLSGVVSLSVSPKAAEEGASAPLAASLSHLKPAAFLQGLNFLRHYWLRFLFCLTASIINFSGGEDTPCCTSDFFKRCYFCPWVYSLGSRSGFCGSLCANVSPAFASGQESSRVYQAGPHIYSNVFVYPVPSLLQCSLLRILSVKHVTKSALYSRVHYLSQAHAIVHFPSQFRPIDRLWAKHGQRMSL